jgi:hypothetical protein
MNIYTDIPNYKTKSILVTPDVDFITDRVRQFNASTDPEKNSLLDEGFDIITLNYNTDNELESLVGPYNATFIAKNELSNEDAN